MKILGKIRKNDKKIGFTMTEVIIATLIFTLAMAGVFASISELRQPAVESTQEVTAAFVGKRILEDLRSQVSAETWNSTGNLILGSTYTDSFSVSSTTYYTTYTVTSDPDGTSARKVILNVTW